MITIGVIPLTTPQNNAPFCFIRHRSNSLNLALDTAGYNILLSGTNAAYGYPVDFTTYTAQHQIICRMLWQLGQARVMNMQATN